MTIVAILHIVMYILIGITMTTVAQGSKPREWYVPLLFGLFWPVIFSIIGLVLFFLMVTGAISKCLSRRRRVKQDHITGLKPLTEQDRRRHRRQRLN